jgi:hypothetical protein
MGNESAGRQLHAQLDTIPGLNFTRAILAVYEKKYDLAIDFLEVAYQSKSWRMANLSVDPDVDPLRDHPRFKKLMEKMNYPKLE